MPVRAFLYAGVRPRRPRGAARGCPKADQRDRPSPMGWGTPCQNAARPFGCAGVALRATQARSGARTRVGEADRGGQDAGAAAKMGKFGVVPGALLKGARRGSRSPTERPAKSERRPADNIGNGPGIAGCDELTHGEQRMSAGAAL